MSVARHMVDASGGSVFAKMKSGRFEVGWGDCARWLALGIGLRHGLPKV